MDIINTNVAQETTELCYIMHFFGSDKGHPLNQGNHTYTRFYYNLFKDVRDRPLRVFENGELSRRVGHCDAAITWLSPGPFPNL